ncbi:MAG: vitamin K epoxide reductase family protein, partial [Candidatus Nanopelagicaceae bacterium]
IMNLFASRRFSGAFMLFGAVSGFIASFLLTIDKIKILKDAQFNPSCNINEVLNCKSVMLSKQAEVFGFPNSLIGIGAFAIFIAVAIAILGNVKFPSWFISIALGGTILGVIFSHWLAYQTTFVIGALCPYCMVAWFGNFLILSSLIQSKLESKSLEIEDESARITIARVSGFVPIFHLVWLSLVIGAAYFAVS